MLDDVYMCPAGMRSDGWPCHACGTMTRMRHTPSMNPVCWRCSQSLSADDPRFRSIFRFVPRPPEEVSP